MRVTASENQAATNRQQYAQLTQLGQQLAGMINPDAILPTIVNTVGEALRVPYAAVRIRRTDSGEDELAAQYDAKDEMQQPGDSSAGQLGPQLLAVPLSYGDELVGTLLVAVRTRDGSHSLSEEEIALLKDFGQRAGAAVRVVRLMHDLRRARERLVVTREEERRLLRRNLHDGIGPTLASLNMRSGTLRKLIQHNPQQAEAQLAEFTEQLRLVVTEIRRVVYNLRPPALDLLGMLPAIREQARLFSAEDLDVTVEAPEQLPVLHAAVEVAAYRIVSEALANVARHAQAHHCWIRLAVDERMFWIEVRDDGQGIPADRPAGVGLDSMRERAVELGGIYSLESAPSKGTIVRAFLPVNLDSWIEPSAFDSALAVGSGAELEGQ